MACRDASCSSPLPPDAKSRRGSASASIIPCSAARAGTDPACSAHSARLRRFEPETMAKAFGLAGSQSAGTFAACGTPTVKFHQCRGALSGLLAALLAEQKFLATREFLTASDGGLY